MHRPIQLTKTTSTRKTSLGTWRNDSKAIGLFFSALLAGLRPASLILAWRIAVALPIFMLFAVASFCPALAQTTRPNVVVILADDLGYADVGFNGCADIPTPNIDSIATNGVLCTNGYVTEVYCSPSRAALLTGRYQQRYGYDYPPPVAS